MTKSLNPLRQTGKLSTYLPFLIVAILALTIGLMLQQKKANAPIEFPEFERTILFDTPRIISDFSLLDENGEAFDKSSLQGQWNLLFFGFTHCPDVCPSTLLALKNVRQKLEAKNLWPDLNVVMVSVDPDRDAPERLKPYVSYFHPEFKGVTGDEDAITAFAKELGILFIKKEADANGYYDVDHGVSMILLNPEGHYAGVLTAPHTEAVLESDLSKLSEFFDIANTSSNANNANQSSSSSQATEPSVSTTEAIQVTGQWVRAAPPNSPALAAYLTVENNADEPLKILGASSPMFERVMIHATVVENGIAGMRHIEEILVPAQQSSQLAPMGTHVMLMRPRHSIKLRDQIPITLTTNQGDVSFIAFVLDQAPE